jgi:hypothetical protein
MVPIVSACSAGEGTTTGPARVSTGNDGRDARDQDFITPTPALPTGQAPEGGLPAGDVAAPVPGAPVLSGTPFGCPTSLSGSVYDPAGNLPLYNVVVYVPSETLAPIAEGAGCETCDGNFSGRPVAASVSAHGLQRLARRFGHGRLRQGVVPELAA